jgi:hypothetical protein
MVGVFNSALEKKGIGPPATIPDSPRQSVFEETFMADLLV